MLTIRIRIIPPLLLVLLFLGNAVQAQYRIKGTVYDSSRLYPVGLVSVLTTSGSGTFTNTNGEYEVNVKETDSIWFSYLNKPTVKFPVKKIVNPLQFDISIQVNIPTLKEVRVQPRNYRQDSLQNREDYAKVFNYKRPGLSVVKPQTQYGAAVGFDLNEIINVFRFRRNKSMLSFQRRLLQQEQDKSVDHRFNKGLVRRLTGLTEPAIDSFMMLYRPTYHMTLIMAEYDFQKYIKDSYERFKKGLPPEYIRFDEEDDFQP